MIDSVPEIDAESTEGKPIAKTGGRIQFIDVGQAIKMRKCPLITVSTRFTSDTPLAPVFAFFET
jgi:hypothetical protein